MKLPVHLTLLLFLFSMSFSKAQTIYNESEVPSFEVPDPLVTFKGKTIGTIGDWENVRRPELHTYFETKVYGKIPKNLKIDSYKILEQEDNALNGKANRRQVELTFKHNDKVLSFTILLYLPKKVENTAVFLGYNFYGNHTITEDESVLISTAWADNNEGFDIVNNTLTAASRGKRTHRWAIEKIIDAGYGLATIYYGEVDPDKDDFSDGIQSLLYSKNQKHPKADEWGSISAWAWGLSKAMDYFEKDPEIDAARVIAFGHSRLGKAALWAGANDKRFAGVISNNSGCGGAALSKRKFGETIGVINERFPHWFCTNFKEFNNKEETLAVDQHQLLALIAPRPLYIASAEEDRWADPKGEFLSALYASSVYELYGKKGINIMDMPVVNSPILNTVAYHIRTGKHDVTDYDWEQYIKWADTFLR
ncbi:Carbohydrate esterase [Arenibacter antarcticus]|uniref:Alpha/beta hydrolase family protein n=1 Tax=Arenibacter antarcticus TaxID=2040469 RepID=A0ABW5VLX3_9FLAO|nr:acetylxylan esterase [Arenibacter sp. H213]MCM4167034.1 acetylxylan esterase [Arenibacter sp. H213]